MNLKSTLGLLLAGLICSLPLAAHEGHDHGDEAAQAPALALPRFAVQGEALEVVGVLAADTLVLYVDQRADNAPVTNLAVEVEGQGWKGVAEPDGLGAYRLPLPAALGDPARGGHHSLTLTLSNDTQADLLAAELVLSEAGPASPAGSGAWNGWPGGPLLLLLLLAGLGAAGVFLRRRSLRKSP